MRDKVLIGYGQGFWGDSILGPVRLVREGRSTTSRSTTSPRSR
jgi:hypothetical protein